MTQADDQALPARPGTAADLSRRMDKMEAAHDALAGEVRSLTTTIGRVEMSVAHSQELNKLRFDSLQTGNDVIAERLEAASNKFDTFLTRFEKLLSGETQTQQGREGEKIVESINKKFETNDERLSKLEETSIQARFLARLVYIAFGSSIAAAIFTIWDAAGRPT